MARYKPSTPPLSDEDILKNEHISENNDKAKHCNKEVPAFRYYDTIIPALRAILAGETA